MQLPDQTENFTICNTQIRQDVAGRYCLNDPPTGYAFSVHNRLLPFLKRKHPFREFPERNKINHL